MKHTLLLTAIIAALFCSTSSQAQSIPGVSTVKKFIPKPMLGLKLGANYNELKSADLSSLKPAYKPGVVFGAFGGIRWKKMGVRAEVLMDFAKYDYSIAGAQSGTFKNLYLDIPILFEIKVLPRIWAQIGPQYSKVLSVSSSPSQPNNVDPKTFFNSGGAAGVLGLEARLPLHIVAGARYVLGITDMHATTFEGEKGAWNARTLQLYLGFRFI